MGKPLEDYDKKVQSPTEFIYHCCKSLKQVKGAFQLQKGGHLTTKQASVPLPVIITREGKWFVAWNPTLDVASQGKTHDEAVKNLREAIELYLEDPDAKKLDLTQNFEVSITTLLAPTS